MIQNRIRFGAYGVAAAALSTALAACGGGSSGGTSGQTVSPASGGSSAALSSHSTSIGMVLADSNGRTIYELVGNSASNPKCDSSCQAIWTPVMSGGSVKVFHGHPLFTYTGDAAAGDVNGENATDTWGTWLALNPSGAAIPATSSGSSPAATPSSPSSGGGGYGY
jgi:predicted lipoprotein with Yx(FWY)xxD motif